MPPELLAEFVVGVQKNVALEDADLTQRGKTAFNHAASEATLSVCRSNGQVMQVASSAIMTAENYSHNPLAIQHSKA